MKREVIFVLIFSLFFINISLICATEEQQVEKAYSCLQSKIDQVKCSSLTFEQKVFSVLATGDCVTELSVDNYTSQDKTRVCWPTACKVKSTAQAVLALNRRVNTTAAEKWLLGQTTTPSDINWFLEIEILNGGAANCQISYPGKTYTIKINESKKISSQNLGSCLKLAQENYWLQISCTSLYNKDIQISCDKPFLTTLLFMKPGSSTVHISETVNYAYAPVGGTTTERIESLCFVSQSGTNQGCNYEASLWATLVLRSLGYNVENFTPYLITSMDDPTNEIYIPESFLYYITGKFRTELLVKQRPSSYWEESGDKYYDTALALLPFTYESPEEKKDAISKLLSAQQTDGCWNSGHIRDTAFLLYSIWPKGTSPPLPPGHCEYDDNCLLISCKSKWCDNNGYCNYEYSDCQHDDGCCNPGCDFLSDNDCDFIVCSSVSDSRCPETEDGELYCNENGDVYQYIYTSKCNVNKKLCVKDTTKKLIYNCTNEEVCESGECIPKEIEPCSLTNRCSFEYKCEYGECVHKEGTPCDNVHPCPAKDYSGNYCDGDTVYREAHTYTCDNTEGICVEDVDEEEVEECPSSKICDNGECVINDCIPVIKPCSSGYKCSNKICVPDIECENDSQCGGTENGDLYCYDNKNVYRDVYTYLCNNNGECESDTVEKKVETCNISKECYEGECKTGSSCGFLKSCKDGYDCVDNWCVPEPECDINKPCVQNGYECENEQCVPGHCHSDTECPEEDCKKASCELGTCMYDFLACINNDYCCEAGQGCNYTTDNDCEQGSGCTSNSECLGDDYISDEYCGGSDDNDLYINFYNYTCNITAGVCVENITNKLIKQCNDNTEECLSGECFIKTVPDECDEYNPCDDGYVCDNGECVEETGCDDYYDCDWENYEECEDNVCVPHECGYDSDCTDEVGGICSEEGECVYENLDCQDYGYCTSQAGCDNIGGMILQDYSCTNSFFKCCDTEPTVLTCEEEGGEKCTSEEECSYGTTIDVSDTENGETCCIGGGSCEIPEQTGSCTDNSGTCRYDYCDDGEEQDYSYTCDSEEEVCCVTNGVSECNNNGVCDSGETKENCSSDCKKGRGWILIVLLLILIVLAVMGIVFRDKVRTQWIKIKDKFSGKKEKKKFEMPMAMHPNPQSRILPRRILHPGQSPPGQQPRFQLRPTGQPISRPSGTQLQVPSGKGTLPQKPSELIKKPEEKPKNELDDVLKKLKEMGKKE